MSGLPSPLKSAARTVRDSAICESTISRFHSWSPTFRTGVGEPGDLIADPGRGGHVEPPVAVQVNQGHVVGPLEIGPPGRAVFQLLSWAGWRCFSNQMIWLSRFLTMTTSGRLSPLMSPTAWAFEPTGFAGLNEVPLERSLAVVLEPVQGIAPRVAARQVEIAVAIEVGRRDRRKHTRTCRRSSAR